MCYDADKNVLGKLTWQHVANDIVVSSADYLTVKFTIPTSYPAQSMDFTNTAYVRFCVAYTDIGSIVITKN